jgi:hypothetical protein
MFKLVPFGYTEDQEVSHIKKLFVLYTLFVFSLGYGINGGRLPMGEPFLFAYALSFTAGVKITQWFYLWKSKDFTLLGYKLKLSFVKPDVEAIHERPVKPTAVTEITKCHFCNGEDVTLNGQVIPCPECKIEILDVNGKVVPIKRKRNVR